MRHDDGWPNAVKKLCKPVCIHLLPCSDVGRKWAERRNMSIESSGIAVGEDPLGVFRCRSPGEKHHLPFLIRKLRRHRAENIGVVRRSAVAWAVDDEHGVPCFHQPLRPAGSSIRRVHPLCTLKCATVNQHDRIRLRYLLRRFPCHKHRSTLVGVIAQLNPFSGNPEFPLLEVLREAVSQKGAEAVADMALASPFNSRFVAAVANSVSMVRE